MIFSEKTFRALLVAGSGAVALIFWFFTVSVWVRNAPLQPLAAARILGWEIEEVRSDRYALRARYTYDWEGNAYFGVMLFEPVYLNEISALSGLKKEAVRSWTVWLDPLKPQNSSLEKIFPSGLLMRASLSTLVLFYFSFVYVRKYFNS